MLLTVIELPEYIKRAENLLTKHECEAIINHVAAFPRSGEIVVGTGGIRKLRWRRGRTGKSGGVRVIYYYHDERIPVFLLTLFGKNERVNLTKSERNHLAKLTRNLVNKALEFNYEQSI